MNYEIQKYKDYIILLKKDYMNLFLKKWSLFSGNELYQIVNKMI